MAECMPRRLVVAAAIALIAGSGAVGGCVIVIGGKGRYDYGDSWSGRASVRETRALTVEHLPGADLDIDTADGSIEVRRHDGSRVEIEARIGAASDSRLDEITILAERTAGGALRIRPQWPGGVRHSWEFCSFLVLIPDAGAVRLASGDGSIRIFGVGTSISAETDDGAIELHDVEGPVDAETNDGPITLRQSGPGAPLRLRTHDGSVRVELDPGFVGSLEVSTNDGRISFTDLDRLISPARFDGVTARRMALVAGDGGPASTIHTGDGAVTLTVRAQRTPD